MPVFKYDKIAKYVIYGCILMFITMFCGLSTFAQVNISQSLTDILNSKDTEKRDAFMQRIDEFDINQMSDTTLLDYYYLAAWHYMDNKEYEKEIEYLSKVKELCESNLGIQYNPHLYFEILLEIGYICETLNKDEEALLWYEEGIVKSLEFLNLGDEILDSYFKHFRNYAADIFEGKGYMDIAQYLRGNKPLDYVGSFDYANDLFKKALELYRENKICDAIALLDDARDIFPKCGDEGKEMMQSLYRLYLLCYAKNGDIKHINKLLRTKKYLMFYKYGEHFFVNDIQEIIAIFINDHHDIKTAEYYYEYLLNNLDENNKNDLKSVNEFGLTLNFFKKSYSKIDSLENKRDSVPYFSYEWGIYSFQLSNVLISIHRYEEANDICKQIYKMSVNLKDDSANLHWFVLMNIADYYILKKNTANAEKYLKEQLAWLNFKKYPENALERGWVFNKLGTVYLIAQQFSESNEMLLNAEKILLPKYGNKSLEYGTILHNKGRLAQLEGKLDEARQYLEESVKIQMEINGKALDKTVKYLDEVKHAMKVRL